MVESQRQDLPVSRGHEPMEVNRSGLYEARGPRRDRDAELRVVMHPVVRDFPGYGYRRVAKELVYQGFLANHRRVLRIMRQNGWLCRLRSRRIHTTQSDHALGVFPNRVNDLVVTRTNQLFVADLTYIRLRDEFIFLAASLDGSARLRWRDGYLRCEARGDACLRPPPEPRRARTGHRPSPNHPWHQQSKRTFPHGRKQDTSTLR